MNIGDPKAAYERLRAETAEMLRLNADSASLIEGLQVDLVALLRFEIDTLQGAVLNGQDVDLKRLEIALGMLRSLLPAQALVSAPPPAEVRFSGEHQRKLRAMIARVVLTPSADDHEREAALMWKDEQMALAAASDNWTWQPAPVSLAAAVSSHAANGDASGGAVPPALSPAASPSPTATSAQPPPQRQPGPSNPPDSRNEPWREFVDENGIRAPYFRPFG